MKGEDGMDAIAAGARKAVALFVVFAAAKLALVALRLVDHTASGLLTPLALPALLSQDVWVALAFGCLVAARGLVGGAGTRSVVKRDLLGALAFWGAALWAAFNVPVARVFSTPLTWTMLGAAGTAIADSIRAYVTASNLAAMGWVLGVAALAPRWVAWAEKRTVVLFRLAWAPAMLLVVAALLLVAPGPWARAHVATIGLHRNALGALVGSLLDRRAPDVAAQGVAQLAALPPLPVEGDAIDLTRFAGAAAGRNVIWISLESTGARYLAPWGGPPPPDQGVDPTPRLSSLARDALVFDAAYAAHPESIKGLFSMLCSAAPAAHSGADHYTAARVPCGSLGEQLQAAGYRTAMFHSGWFAYLGMQGIVDGRGFDQLVDAGAVTSPYRTSFGVEEPTMVARALAWLDQRPEGRGGGEKARPFFLMYLPIAGHHPYSSPGLPDPARPFPRDSDLHEYYNDLHRGDLALGQLVDGIRARGLDESTLWVIVGDHGEAFFQHEGNFAHTLFAYEENVRVPLLVRAPGVLRGATHVPQIASVIDVAPTVLALLGRPAPGAWEGRSLLAPVPGSARFYVDQAVWTAGLRSGPWKLLLDVDTGRTQLFNLVEDPAETHDRSASEPERTRRYQGHVAAWAAAQRARFAR